ncbi:nucleotide exchange factor GrpE [Cumulibacter manganitolerans]|uniref:nucleotide exchange factor GrpE n=1 Tax=Cumulibacter manganitolerans TaxID=1884992 RepID=UPI001E33DC55|nr:nucleotide exchange factor GrpE [Cumulibacter manganitolerans]
MTDPQDRRGPETPVEAVGPDADDALDHALRERPVDEDTDFDFDDAAGHPAAGDDAEDYVLYSEVRPHLEALVQLQNERAKMVDLLLYARDRVSSPAVAARMDDNLAQLGIQVLVPRVGERFDPQRHEASATVHTDDPAQQGTIAELELAGYADGDRVVRHPVVTVFALDRGGSA